MMAGGRAGRSMMMRRGLAMRFAALDLSDQQRDKLRDIHEQAARKSVQRRADMQLARMDLQKLMRADTPSASAINTQIDKGHTAPGGRDEGSLRRVHAGARRTHARAAEAAARRGWAREMNMMDGEAPPKR